MAETRDDSEGGTCTYSLRINALPKIHHNANVMEISMFLNCNLWSCVFTCASLCFHLNTYSLEYIFYPVLNICIAVGWHIH